MKKKIFKGLVLLFCMALAIVTIVNLYKWIVCGKQSIVISTVSKAYTNSDVYVSVQAFDEKTEIDAKTKVSLINSNGRKVKNVKTVYENGNTILSIPDIESGNYFIEANVSSKIGKDTVKKAIYISNGKSENITITFDKGIYKPGDNVNFRALITEKQTDTPVGENTNVSIYDGNENRVYNKDIKTSDYGIITGSFKLADEVNSGIYKLVVKTEATETIKEFKVNPYVTPKYEVNINFDKDNYLVNDKAKIEISSKYFFGENTNNTKYTVFIDDKQISQIESDETGIATLEYEIKDAKKYNVRVEAVDSSNYYVEASNSFTAGTDLYEIKLLPEFETLISGISNDVYVFTQKADGTPVKTYVTVVSDNYTKQIATDENGIGKFTIDINDNNTYTNNYNLEYENNYDYNYNFFKGQYSKNIKVTAQNMDGEEVKKDINLSVSPLNSYITTDKVKYNQGEDINVKVFSASDEDINNVFFFKGDKLIKTVSTSEQNTSVNLGEEYGLIDIVIQKDSINNYYNDPYINNSYKYYKKTIFIKPTKKLNIDIITDKSEYLPGENIKLTFNTTDEKEQNIDAALLVSMIDNSILSLESNDLSIDNIKLALSDIKFTNDLDAATLYSCIVDDKSEATMMALLLKQKSSNIYLSESKIKDYDTEERASAIFGFSTFVLVLTIFIICCVKFKKFRKSMIHILNILIYTITLYTTALLILILIRHDYSYTTSMIVTIIGAAITAIATYFAWIIKICPKINRTSISIVITFILSILAGIASALLSAEWILIAVFSLIVVVAIISIINGRRKKESKFNTFLVKEIVYAAKFVLALLITFISIIFTRIPIVPIALLYFLNYKFNRLGKEEEKQKSKKTNVLNVFIIALAIIGIIAIIALVSYYLNIGRRAMNSAIDYSTDTIESIPNDQSSSLQSGYSPSSVMPTQPQDGIEESLSTNILESLVPNMDAFKSKDKNVEDTKEIKQENRTETKDTKIRNLFLESMCFIPELISSNGQANLEMELSDNITTWTIQTIGNTKDGRVGFGITDSVRVFKDFFVDFSLPNNLVNGDEISIPVTVYNYTDDSITTELNIEQQEWFTLNTDNTISVEVGAKSSKLVYIPITITKFGDVLFKVEAKGSNNLDIIERKTTVSPKGYKVEKVVSTGKMDENINEDILILDSFIENTAKAKVKIYASSMSQTVEGMENIFRMPTGCFEQVSSSLYPNILALRYLEENGIVNEDLKNKAIDYISSGYQKLLAYEVKGESGGYSLYGSSPAETVLTAYGLMEITDLSKVYKVDENVIQKMNTFIYKKQNMDGSFEITGDHLGGANSSDKLALNAYITWALSESNPDDKRLDKSIQYLKGKVDTKLDNYTLALIANAFANVKDKEVNNVIKILVGNVQQSQQGSFITSKVVDYYGSRSNVQTLQTTALTSMVLSKTSKESSINNQLIKYIISQKNTYGTWSSTQATILALKALNTSNENNKINNQTITVKVNSDEKQIEIKDNPLDIYTVSFENLGKENKLNINMKKGGAYYEVIEEYYIPYENIDNSKDNIEITVDANTSLSVNEILDANIKLINNNSESIYNGMVTINIPQGFTTVETSLMELQNKGIIEKYEMNYSSINIYLRDISVKQIVNLIVKFRASYPVHITGLGVRAYDYYNPEVEGKSLPVEITVN